MTRKRLSGSCAAGLKAGVPIAAERRPKGVSLWDYGPKGPFGVRFEERSDSPSTAPATRWTFAATSCARSEDSSHGTAMR